MPDNNDNTQLVDSLDVDSGQLPEEQKQTHEGPDKINKGKDFKIIFDGFDSSPSVIPNGQNPDDDSQDRKLDRKHRGWLLVWVMIIVSVWLMFVVVILILVGCKYVPFEIGDSVMNVLLATTTVNIIGLPLAIIKGWFNKKYTPTIS